jgi:hypothetical protein
MIQRRERLCFALEPGNPIAVGGKHIREDFDRDVAVELRIPRAVDLAHSAGTERRDDLINTEPRAWCQRHVENAK